MGYVIVAMQRFSRLIVIALVAVAPALGVAALPVSGATAADVTVTVSVMTDSGNPVSSAQIEATWGSGSSTATTASNGKAFVDVPEGSDVTVRISHPDYVQNHPYTISGASESDVTVTVFPKATSRVRVVDQSGSPVADASVEFKKDGRSAVKARTDTNGVVTSGVIEAGQYTITVFKEGYFRKSYDLRVVGDTSADIPIERGLVSVEFRVLDDHFDPPKPIEGATITGDDIGSVRTQSNGVQRVSVPVNSQLSVTVEKEGYQSIDETMLVNEQDKQVDLTTTKTPFLEIEVLADRVVAGTRTRLQVTDEYGDPATRATVYLDGNSVGMPDAEGEILVPIDDPGQHTLHAEDGEVSSDEVSVEAIEPRTELPNTPMMTADSPNTPQTGPGAGGPGFVAAGTITDQGIHLVSAGIGIGIGFILALLIVLYMQLGGSG